VDLARLLRVERPPAATRFNVLGKVRSSAGVAIEAVEVASAPAVWIPAWVFLPAAAPNATYVLLEPGGRNGRWREDDLYPQLARAGAMVCVPDLRGIGDLVPEIGRGAPRYANEHREEEHYAWASLMLGKPMLGQWVTDVLAVVDALAARPEARGQRLVVGASGKLTTAALIAASLDRRVQGLYLEGGLKSYEELAKTENYRESFANFVPGILRYTDLPDIAASLGGTKIVRGDGWDAAAFARAL
jgi:hypothetical protein